MQKIMVICFFLTLGTTGFAETIVLNNQLPTIADHPESKIAIQWATSAKDVEQSNNRVRRGLTLKPDTLQVLTHRGIFNLGSPKEAEYFRVLVWKKGVGAPDFLTNWVDVVPKKTYTINQEFLIPMALMAGTGC